MRSLMFKTETIDFCDLARVLTLSLLTIPLLSYGSTVTGIVTNKTTGKPAAGDSVVLIGLTSNMQEISRTKTNAAGHYSIEVPEVGMHLIRVDHQKAAYFAAVAPGATNADVVVYDVATRVPGITTDAEVLRVETDPQGLHVTQSYLVGNSSSPPRTQFGTASYEIYLPAGVQPEQPIAMGPGGMPVVECPAFSEPVSMRETLSQGAGYGTKEEVHP
jgi:5-hydroxyisourate hydrolase-like protein (transthyretin family)